MPGGNQIRFGIGFDVNKAGLNELKKSLLEIQQLSKKDLLSNFGGNEQKTIDALKKAKAAARELDAILTKTFNSNLGTVNISRFQSELNKLGADGLNRIYSDLSSIGAQGTNAFNKLATSAMTTNVKLKQTFSILESMKITLANTVKWTIASTAVNSLTGSISNAFNYVKALDASLTDIRIVTGQSREEMAQFAVQANVAAQALGRQTKEYTNAALTFYQQGLGEAEVQARTEATLKAQNVTGAGTEMADYLTAVWNGFKVSAENTELYVDKLAAVADSSASNLSELAIAMSKVASTANNMGVDIDQLSAQISTIVATTRQAPETVGNALKTIYARINDIKSGSDEAEISLGNYTGRMQKLGISVLDANGRLRDTGEVMEEIGSKWTSMTREQQIYLAQTMAGQRQMNNLVALFDNWQQYSDMLNVSLNAQGSLNEKNARYMDSISAHINQFKAATEGLQDTLIDENAVKSVIDAGTGLVNLFNDLLTAMGGMQGAGLALSGVLLNTFSSNIADGILKISQNLKDSKDNAVMLEDELKIIREFQNSDVNGTSSQIALWAGQANQFQQAGIISSEQRAELNQQMQNYNDLVGQKQAWEEAEAATLKYLQSLDNIGEKVKDIAKINVESKTEIEAAITEIDESLKNQEDIVLNLERNYKSLEAAKRNAEESKSDYSRTRYETYQDRVKNDLFSNFDFFEKIAKDPSAFGFDEQSKLITELRNNLEGFEDDLLDEAPVETYAQRHIDIYRRITEAMRAQQQEAAGIVREGVTNIGESIDIEIAHIQESIQKTLEAAALKQQIQGIINILGGIAGSLGGLTAISNSFKVFSNETLTSGQKFIQFTQSFAMGLSMLMLNLRKLGVSITSVRAAILTLTKAEEISALQTLRDIGLSEAKTAAEKKEVIQTYNTIVAEKMRTVSLKETTLALLEQIKAIAANALAWAAAHWQILAIAAAIGAAILVVRGIAKALDAQNIAAQEAAKRAEELGQRYRDIKQAYDELKSSLNDYKDSKKALDQMVVGTEEWKEALQEVNDQVLELINKYPELAQYVSNVNGELILSEKGQAELLRTQQEQVQRTQQTSLLASNEARTAENRVVTQRLAKSSGVSVNDTEQILKAIAQNNQILVDWTKARGDNSGEALGDFIRDYQNDFHDVSMSSIAAVLANTSQLQESINTMKANTAANEANTDAIVSNAYQSNQNYQNSPYQDAVNRVSNRILDDESLQKEAALILAQPGKFSQDILDEYAQYQGYQLGSGTSSGIFKKGYNFVNASGESVEGVDASTIANVIAYNRALNELNDTAFQEKNIEKVNSVAAIAPELVDFIEQTGDFSAYSFNQVKEIMNKIPPELNAIGLAMKGISLDNLNKAARAAETAIDDIINGIESKSVKDAISNLLSDVKNDVSANDAKTLTNLLQSVFVKSGKTSLDSIVKLFGEFSTDKYNKLFEIISNFSSGTTLDQLTKQLQDAGIETNNFEEAINSLYNYLKTDTEAIVKNFKDAKDVASGIEFGDGISEDDAKKLEAIGINLDEFFMTGTDGMQILIADAKELRDTIDQMQMSQLVDQMNTASEGAKELADYLVTFNPNNLSRSNIYSTDSGEHLDFSVAQQQYDYLQQLNDQGLGDVTTEELAVWQDLIAVKKDDSEVSKADKESLDALSDAVQRNIGQVDELKKNQNTLVEEYKNSKEALDSFRLKLDEDIDEEEWRNLTKTLNETASSIEGVSEELENDKIASAELAQAILRFDDAIVDVADHYEDWKKALSHGSLQEQTEAMEEMRDAYADLLDLDGDSLSDTFLKSTENLELMQQAANGSEDAYNQLKEAVQEDIIAHLHLSPEDMAEFQSNLSEVESALDAINFEDLEIGADLNIDNFLASLTDMVNAAGMTAEQATDYLASMGVDAQVVEHNTPTTEEKETGDVEADLVPVTGKMQVPIIQGTGLNWSSGTAELPYQVYGVSYKPKTTSYTTTSDNKAVSLQVTSAHKSSGGGFKYKQASHGGGSKKAGKSGGGGKGGGGSKPKEPAKPFKSKIDPYHDVNIKIGNVKEGLDKLNKDRDKLIGKDAVENLRKQVDLMEQEKELLREKAEIAKSELQRQGQELANLGAIFDANGDIANYSQLLLDKQKQINEAITYGNTLQGDQRDAYDKYVKDLEQEYKDLETAIKDYDATQQLLDDLELDYADLINEQIEKAIEAFDLEIELHLDLKDAQKEFNEFRKKIIDQIQDDEFGRLAEATARNYQNYYNVGADGNVGGIIPELRQHVQQIYNELQVMTNGGFSQIYGDNLAAAAEDLKKYNDELMKNLEEAQDVIDETHQNFLDAIDSLSDAFDKQQEAFDKIDTFLEHDIELIQLVRGEEDYAALTGLWEQQVATDAQRLDKLRQQQDYWREQIDQYEEGTDEWKAAMENWQNSFEALNEAMINSVKNLQSQWENSINAIMKDLRNQAFGGNMNSALEQWEKMEWHSDRYLDSLSRANGLLDLQSQYTKAINETDDPKLRQQLTDLEEQQLEALSNKEHLREIDLKIAQQQLTVMQAQMALEDAQQSKTKMRLRRDSQGNYTYQYVADEDNIAEKTQEYANALEEYRTMVKESLHEDLQDLSDYTQEFFDKIQDAQMQFGDDAEALNARIAEITEQYTGPEGYITRLVEDANYDQQELQKATFTQAVELYGQLGEAAFDAFTGPDQSILAAAQELLDANNGKIPTLLEMFKDDTYQQFLDGITQDTWDQLLDPDHGLFHDWNSSIASIAQNYQEKFLPEVADAMYQLQVVHQAYLDGLGIIQNAANRTFGQIAAGLDADTGYSYSLITATDELVEAQKAQVEQANAVYDALKRNEEAFKDQTKAAIDAANAMFLYWLTLNGQTTSSLPYSVEGYTGVRSNPSSTKASPNNYSSSNSGGSSGSGGSSNNSASGSPGYTSSGSSGKYDWRGIPWEYSPDNPNRKKSASFASGGYTGSWGDNGRIAVLHQKELVLNEDDTKNVLKAVNITRAITSGVSSMAAAALSNLSGGHGYSTLESTTDSILQNVVINADFPAVQDAAQIKQAFNELVNIASQRASKNRRAY